MIKKNTKIIATIGPSSEDSETIKELINAGVDVFRFNMKHADVTWHEKMIDRVQSIADEMKVYIGIMIDLQGPEIRVKTNGDIELEEGDELEFIYDIGNRVGVVGVKHKIFFETINVGDEFSVDDGFTAFEVISKSDMSFIARAKDKGGVKNNKGLNLVGKNIDVPSLVDDDIKKLHVATKKRIDFVALSFVRSKQDIKVLRDVMKDLKIDAGIVSKVESKLGLDNIDEIIEESDAVMVARGDLGIEVPIEELTFHQKDIIKRCRTAKTPVIVATQMLESMIVKPIPSRAEATDVSNAIFDGADAIMLSGESALGKYPVRAVKAMAKIAKFNEKVAEVVEVKTDLASDASLIINAASTLAKTAAKGNNLFTIDYIVAVTETGNTARAISSYRQKSPIIALTPNEKTAEKLKMSYGVLPIVTEFPKEGELIHPDDILSQLKSAGLVQDKQLVLVVYGQRKEVPGKTNSIVLLRVD